MNLLVINQLNSSLRHIIVQFTIFNLFQMYYDLDTELSYQCDPGYKRKGFQVAQCFFYNGTARWFGPDLKCHPIDCGAPEEILNGKRAGDCTTYRCQVLPMYMYFQLGVVHKLRWKGFGFFFDHLPSSVDIFYLIITKSRNF